MTSARRSTGPRSAAGKARSAQNATRHGLAVPVLADPHFSREVRELARRLGAEDADGDLALAVAEAHVDVTRIRQLRHALIARALERFGTLEPLVRIKAVQLLARATNAVLKNQHDRADALIARVNAMLPAEEHDPAARETAVLRHLAGELSRLDRYERRALSRRKFAIRAFDAAGKRANAA